MTPEIITSIMEKSISIAVLIFIVLYFMKQIEKKDSLHNETTKEFMTLARESNVIHIETKNAITANTEKLQALYNDSYTGKFCKSKSS